MWDAIVIGPGISGLAAGATLSRTGKRMLLLEQHTAPGGQTQTYRRGDWTFATGVPYLVGLEPSSRAVGHFGLLLERLFNEQIQFTPLTHPYDIVRLPGLEFGIGHPEAAYRSALLERFPHDAGDIDRGLDGCNAAREQACAWQALHSAPLWATFVLPMLAMRWPDYGAQPSHAPFIEHAIVTGAYNEGAYSPVGGPARFVVMLVSVVPAAGGELRLGADVRRIVVERGRAAGVVYSVSGGGREERARHVTGTMGAANLVSIGFKGDISAAGASLVSAEGKVCGPDAGAIRAAFSIAYGEGALA